LRILRAGGHKIHKLGVIPDVEAQQNADYKNVAVESIPEGSDARSLSKAIEVLKNEIGQ
jgi:C-terminal processing protease CtpA/Prc